MAQLIAVMQLDQERCANVYGTAPCTASGAAGTECFNTFKSCQDTANFATDADPLTLSFHTECENPLLLPGLFPTLKSWQRTPGTLNIASADPDKNPLGTRDIISASLQDHPYHDRYVDPYFRTRTYNAISQGQFWSKWLARNDNYEGTPCRFYIGFAGDALESMTVYHYQLEKITGPDSSGNVGIEIIDVLKSADDDRVKIPAVNSGALTAAITTGSTTFTVEPAGVGNSEYDASGSLSIGGEKMTFTRTGDDFTVVRSADPQSHDEGSIVQQAEIIDRVRVDAIAKGWLLNDVGVPAEWIDDDEWEEEGATYLPTYTIDAEIYKPEGANKLIGNLLRDCSAFLIPDLESKRIRLRAIREQGPVKTITEDNEILAGSFKQMRKPELRLTQLWINYGIRDPIESATSQNNFSHFLAIAGPSATRAREQKIKEIYSRFLQPRNVAEVSQTGSRIMTRFGDEPVEYAFALDRLDAVGVKLGEVVNISHRELADEFGAATLTPVQITSVHQQAQGTKVLFKAQSYGFDFGSRLIPPDSVADWTSATDEQRALYLFLSDDSGLMSDGEPGPELAG